jgi:glycosyltransferase involved in cell wall biosynthesis
MLKVILTANTDWYLYNFRLSLARYLRDQGLEVMLVSPPGRYASYLDKTGFRWIPWPVGRQSLAPWTEARAYRLLKKIYQDEKPDIVHHFTVKPVLYGSLAARKLRVPAVINSITGLGYVFLSQEYKAHWLRALVLSGYRSAFSHPNQAAIFENANDRQVFLNHRLLSADRTYLIEGVGVDTDRFTPQPEVEGTPLVVLPSRMLWDKGVGTLVEAARLLHERLPVRIALVGEPDPGNPATIDEAQLNAWTQEGLVEYWGWQADMPAVFAQSMLVTLPSLGEGVPTVLLEAASSGRAIVATDVPGCREAVIPGVTGLLVPSHDASALAHALYTLLADPTTRLAMGSAGRQMVLDRFTNTQINQATWEVYRSVMQ